METNLEACAKKVTELEDRVNAVMGLLEWHQHDLIDICKDLEEIEQLMLMQHQCIKALTDVVVLLTGLDEDDD